MSKTLQSDTVSSGQWKINRWLREIAHRHRTLYVPGAALKQMQKGIINAFLRKMYKYHFVSECFDLDAIMDDGQEILKTLFSPSHCLHPASCQNVKSNP